MIQYFTNSYNVVIVFIVTLAMNWLVEVIKSDSGYIRQGQAIYIGSDRFIPVDIENQTSGSINGVKVLVSIGLEPGDVFSSRPIQIEKVELPESLDRFNLFEISGLSERSITRIFFPVKNYDSVCCDFLNIEELGLSFKTDGSVSNPLMTSFWKGVQIAIIYSLLMSVVVFWLKLKIKELVNKSEIIEERFARSAKDFEERESAAKEMVSEVKKGERKLIKSMAELRKTHNRQKVFLLRRTSDYEKELNFWRDTIRKMILSKGSDKASVNKMLREISKSIETLSTHGNIKKEYEDFEALREVIKSIDYHSHDRHPANAKPLG